ncbi:hypothetical protein M199_gp231 [Halogranum tailed virus 1]|uniref:Uncharacterized protein n=1 Tax=Halogranum tailed virus 1 TaxID=1273749 RepID=R4T963_9CAUD|nr:hypothetical protein M199_gp231 [Halogranum tailed virus 1]AGM11435.1 hypothetical protein HGTV1_138 [Halogranum tailed virus 1]
MTTYGDFPGVKVSTTSADAIEARNRELSHREKVETMVCIYHCIGDGYIHTNGVQSALESLGYSSYETLPMLWKTLAALDEELNG